ncbi:unnamed protein product [Closterium sp. NIES-64]|nr:unnamed protein product [Closterium sp. NIES-64]
MAEVGAPPLPLPPPHFPPALPPPPPRSIPLPPNHLDTLKTVLQLLGNFCGGGRQQQQAVWDRCFPGTFSRIAAAGGAAGRAAGVRSALCMVLFTCVHSPASSIDPWLSLLLERLCLRGSFFKPLFTGLGREGETEREGEEGEQEKGGGDGKREERSSLTQLDGGRCRWEQAGLLWGVWGALAAVAEAQGVSAGVGGGAKGESEESEESEEKGGKVAKEGKGEEQKKGEQGESFPLVGSGSLNYLLTVCRGAARAVARAQAQGLLLSPGNQQCVAGDSTQGDDLLREWGLWAVRNLLEGNPENAADVTALEVRGGARTEGLREMGLAVEVDERSGRPKLRNIGVDGK